LRSTVLFPEDIERLRGRIIQAQSDSLELLRSRPGLIPFAIDVFRGPAAGAKR
jgi:hypothetical protein